MLSFEEAGYVLDDLVEALPEEIFKNLNGGISLLEDSVKSESGRITLGTYFSNRMGRYIELYYGSFVELYGNMDDELFRSRLKHTLHHELTHHVENMAGDRSLEHWDERSAELCGFNGIEVKSILFVDDDCSALAPAAKAVFDAEKQDFCDDIEVAYACTEAPARLNERAIKHLDYDVVNFFPQMATEELIRSYSVVLCMSIRQADVLGEKYQHLEERIMCLAEDDIEPPLLQAGWKKTMARLTDEVLAVIDEIGQERM